MSRRFTKLFTIGSGILAIIYFAVKRPTVTSEMIFYLSANILMCIEMIMSVILFFKKGEKSIQNIIFQLLYLFFIAIIIIILYFTFLFSMSFTGINS